MSKRFLCFELNKQLRLLLLAKIRSTDESHRTFRIVSIFFYFECTRETTVTSLKFQKRNKHFYYFLIYFLIVSHTSLFAGFRLLFYFCGCSFYLIEFYFKWRYRYDYKRSENVFLWDIRAFWINVAVTKNVYKISDFFCRSQVGCRYLERKNWVDKVKK